MGQIPRTEQRLSARTTVKIKGESKDTRKGLKTATRKNGPR
jgi:hypothetical protein